MSQIVTRSMTKRRRPASSASIGLPDDVWAVVLGSLSAVDKCAAAQVCKQLARVAGPILEALRPVRLSASSPDQLRAHTVYADHLPLEEGTNLVARKVGIVDTARLSGNNAATTALETIVASLAEVPSTRLRALTLVNVNVLVSCEGRPCAKRDLLALSGTLGPSARPGRYFDRLKLSRHAGWLEAPSMEGLTSVVFDKCMLNPATVSGLGALETLVVVDTVCPSLHLADLPRLAELRLSGAGLTVKRVVGCPRLVRVSVERSAYMEDDAFEGLLESLVVRDADPHWDLRAVRRELDKCVLDHDSIPALAELEVLIVERTCVDTMAAQPRLRELRVVDSPGAWDWNEARKLERCELRNLPYKQFVSRLPSLRFLSLEALPLLVPVCLADFPRLEELSVARMSRPFCRGHTALLPKLRTLSMNGCSRLVGLCGSLRAPNLARLRLRACADYDLVADCLFRNFSHVGHVELDLAGCPPNQPTMTLPIECADKQPAIRELVLRNVHVPVNIAPIASLCRLEIDRRSAVPVSVAGMDRLETLRVDNVETTYSQHRHGRTVRYYSTAFGRWQTREARVGPHCNFWTD